MLQRRQFTKEFISEAVQLAQTSKRSKRKVAGDLGVGYSTLMRWIKQNRQAASHGQQPEANTIAELRRLRRENELIRQKWEVACQERDILKQAVALFAREGRG